MAGVVFEDIFDVKNTDVGGKKFDKDVNTQIYPLHNGEKFKMVLSTTLNDDGTPTPIYFNRLAPTPAFMDQFDYVMHGKVYQIMDVLEKTEKKISIYVSYGGLLMNLKGEVNSLSNIEMDKNVFLLIKKIAF